MCCLSGHFIILHIKSNFIEGKEFRVSEISLLPSHNGRKLALWHQSMCHLKMLRECQFLGLSLLRKEYDMTSFRGGVKFNSRLVIKFEDF